MNVAGYILTGGKNHRMNGNKKLFLDYREKTFFECLVNALSSLGNVYLSVDSEANYQQLSIPLIVDIYPAIGPLGGIYSGLKRCQEAALFVVSCDTPRFTKGMADKMLDVFYQKRIPVIASANGRLHPLIGIYPKECLPVIERLINAQDYKMMHLLKQINYLQVDFSDQPEDLINVNTPDEYKRLQEL